jgi:hypothetical protein
MRAEHHILASLTIYKVSPAITNPKNPRPTVPTRRPLEPLSDEVEVAEAEAAVFEPEVAPARMLVR